MNELQKALARQQELVTLARNEGRDLTAEEQAEFNRCQTVIDAAGNEGGEAVGQPAGGERGAENGGQGAPAGTTQGGVSDSQRAVAEERQRTADIMALCRQTGMDPAEYIRSGASMDDVRAAAVDFLIQHNGPVGTRMSDNSREQDNFRQAATDALLMRSGIDVERPTESAEQMRPAGSGNRVYGPGGPGHHRLPPPYVQGRPVEHGLPPVLQPHGGLPCDPGQHDPQGHCAEIPGRAHHLPGVDHQGQRDRL